MFDVSLTELMVIGVVALIVIGPERLPKVARTAGILLGRLQRYVSDVKAGTFPDDDHSYTVDQREYERFLDLVEKRRHV